MALASNALAFNQIGISNSSGAPTLEKNCVYGNSQTDYSGLTPGPSDIHLDPRFFNLELSDFHLRANSPCIDAGDDSMVQPGQRDFDGQPRINGPHVDIGADEYYPGHIGPAGPPIEKSDTLRTVIHGTIHFTRFIGTPPPLVEFEVRRAGETTAIETQMIRVLADGTFTMGVPSGPHDISIKPRTWLRRTVPQPGIDEIIFDLINGDAHDDMRSTQLI